MRIAFVSAHYSPFVGGVESHIVQIATRMARDGHEVAVVTHQEADRDLPDNEIVDGVLVHRFPVPVPSRNYAFSPKMLGFLRHRGADFDVVHAHGYHALPALASAVLRRGALVFTPHYHGTGHSPFRKLLHRPYRQLGKVIFERADRTIAVSPPEARLIVSHFPQTEARLTVIPNGVDQTRLSAADPFLLNEHVVLSAGRIETYKQVDKTIAAMKHLPEQYVLRVTGDGGARPDVESLTLELGLEKRVTFLGRVSDDDLYRWLRTASVYVSMSSNEAMPVTFIEALAAGARVVASDIPAHQDLVTKTRGAITLVPLAADPSAVAAAIEDRMAAPVPTARVDSWDDVTNETLDLYREILGQR
jgi:glycosyltransferase involved in cell wall biosynthesis